MTMPPADRRLFLAGALSLPVVTLPALPAGAADLEKLRVSIIPISDVTPLFVAIEKGFFTAEGIAVDTTPSSGGATGIPGMIAGSFDIVYGNVVSALLASQQGLDIRTVAVGTKTIAGDTDNSQIIVRADSDITSGKQLEGKTFGVNTRNNVIWLYGRAWIKKTGGDPDRVTFREVPFPQMEDAIRQKQVDAGFVVAPFSTVMLGKPDFKSVGKPYTQVQPGVNVGQYLATGQFYKDRQASVEKFVRGLRRGVEWYNANLTSPELLTIVAGFTRINISLLKEVTLSPAPVHIEPDQIETTMRLMIENKLLKQPLDLSKIIAPTAL